VFMNVNLSPNGCDFNLLVGILTIGAVGVDALRRVSCMYL
jgi:hypothetical protein